MPLAVGDATPDEVAEVLERAVGRAGDADRRQLRPVALSPLRRGARDRPRARADAILALSPTLDHEQACGATPINGLLLCARRRGLAPELLDLRNSGDTAGDKSRVVGYASFAFVEGPRRCRT